MVHCLLLEVRYGKCYPISQERHWLGLWPRPFRNRIAGLHNCSATPIQNILFVFYFIQWFWIVCFVNNISICNSIIQKSPKYSMPLFHCFSANRIVAHCLVLKVYTSYKGIIIWNYERTRTSDFVPSTTGVLAHWEYSDCVIYCLTCLSCLCDNDIILMV